MGCASEAAGPIRTARNDDPSWDGSTHEWVVEQKWDSIVTMDDATNWHYSMFFVDEEGTVSSLRGAQEVIVVRGLFSSFYSDRQPLLDHPGSGRQGG